MGPLNDRYGGDSTWIYALLIVIVALTAAAFYRQEEPEWRGYQKSFARLLGARFGPDAQRKFSVEIRQVWLKGINRIDRCTTCHLGTDIARLAGDDVPMVFRAHPNPGGLMTHHPVKDFGCTLCHGGNGYALDRADAHYSGAKGWGETFLSRDLARRYGFSDASAMPLIEINCNACHVFEREVPGLFHINTAKKIFEDKLCTCCHNFHGKGGLVGPDLTYEGDKPVDLYDFTAIRNWEGLTPSVFSWHMLHFRHPYFVTLTTLMPNLNLTDEEIRALTMLVLSYKRVPEGFMAHPEAQRMTMVNPVRGSRVHSFEREIPDGAALHDASHGMK